MELLKTLPTKKARPVQSFDQISGDAEAMLYLLDRGLKRNDQFVAGAALHHAQVCAEPFNFFVVAREYARLFNDRRIIVNGRIVDQRNLVPFSEGCLSFLDRSYPNTRRFEWIRFAWWYADSRGRLRQPYPHETELTNFPAFLIQHELDHAAGHHIHDGRFAEYNDRIQLNREPMQIAR